MHHDFRGFAGRVAGGVFRKGDPVQVLPSGFQSTIKSIHIGEHERGGVPFAPQSVVITLADEIDISRGDMIVGTNNLPESSQDIDVMLCWFNERPLQPNGKYAIKHTTPRCPLHGERGEATAWTSAPCARRKAITSLGMNDIGRVVHLRTTVPLHFDKYQRNRYTGSLILIDEGTNETVAAGMIV
jgi:sulfate adenylyltransferase subunit 1